MMKLRHDCRGKFTQPEKKNDVFTAQHRRTFGDDDIIAAIDGHDASFHFTENRWQMCQRLAIHRCPLLHGNTNHAHLASGKVDNLHGTGMFNDALNMFGDKLLRTDNDIDWNIIVIEKVLLTHVFHRTDPRNLGRRSKQGISNLYRNNIRFIGVGCRDDHIDIFSAGISQHFRKRRLPNHGTQV